MTFSMLASTPSEVTASRVMRSSVLQLVQPGPRILMIMVRIFFLNWGRLGAASRSGEQRVEQVADGDYPGGDDTDVGGE